MVRDRQLVDEGDPERERVCWRDRRGLERGSCSSLHYYCTIYKTLTSQVALVVKNLRANAGDIRDMVLIAESGRFPEVGNGFPLQYFCLENSMSRGA